MAGTYLQQLPQLRFPAGWPSRYTHKQRGLSGPARSGHCILSGSPGSPSLPWGSCFQAGGRQDHAFFDKWIVRNKGRFKRRPITCFQPWLIWFHFYISDVHSTEPHSQTFTCTSTEHGSNMQTCKFWRRQPRWNWYVLGRGWTCEVPTTAQTHIQVWIKLAHARYAMFIIEFLCPVRSSLQDRFLFVSFRASETYLLARWLLLAKLVAG